MDWSSFSHFLHMDGHGAYVWAAYGMCALLLVIELSDCATAARKPRSV